MMEKKNDNVILAFVTETKSRMTCKAEDDGTQDSDENRGTGRGGTVCELDPECRAPMLHKSC